MPKLASVILGVVLLLAGTIASLIYTVVLAELVLRPLKHRLA